MNTNYPEELLEHMKSFKYGQYKHNGIWYIQSPDNLEKSKLGVCHDFSRYIYDKLSKAGYQCQLVYVTDSAVSITHSFVTYVKDKDTYWIEAAWSKHFGIHKLQNGYMDVVKIWSKSENLDMENIAVNEHVAVSKMGNKNLTWNEYLDIVTEPFKQESLGNEGLSKICQDISLQQHQIAQMSYVGYEDLNSIKRLFRNAANNVYRILQNVRSTVWNGFKDLKRSELQSYVDHNRFTVSHILDTKYAILANMDVHIPFKMSSTYYQAVAAVENTLLLLDMENRINTELNVAKAIVSQLMAKSTELSLGTDTVSSYELEKLQTSFTKQDACFRSSSRVTKKRFDQIYRRPSSFKDTYTKLSKLTQYEYSVAKVCKCLENIYKQYDIMVNFLEKENPDIDKNSLARVHQHTYTIAKMFDMYGTTMMNVLRLEHNFVLTLEEIKKTHNL